MKQVVIEPVAGAQRIVLYLEDHVKSIALGYVRKESGLVERVTFCPCDESVIEGNARFPLWKPAPH